MINDDCIILRKKVWKLSYDISFHVNHAPPTSSVLLLRKNVGRPSTGEHRVHKSSITLEINAQTSMHSLIRSVYCPFAIENKLLKVRTRRLSEIDKLNHHCTEVRAFNVFYNSVIVVIGVGWEYEINIVWVFSVCVNTLFSERE